MVIYYVYANVKTAAQVSLRLKETFMTAKLKMKDGLNKSNLVYLKPRTKKPKTAVDVARKKTTTHKHFTYIQKLIVEHQEQGMKMAWRFLKTWQIRMNNDEIRSLVGLALVEAGKRFDPSKEVAFGTFFFYHLRGILLKEITRLVDDKRNFEYLPGCAFTSDDDLIEFVGPSFIAAAPVEGSVPDLIIQRRELTHTCWSACAALDELEREVVYRHFVDDQPVNAIAKELKYCRCHISRVKSSAIAKLKATLGQSKVIEELFLNKESEPKKVAIAIAQKVERYRGGRGRRRSAKELLQ